MTEKEIRDQISNYQEIIRLYQKAFAITALQKDKDAIKRCEQLVEQLKTMMPEEFIPLKTKCTWTDTQT
ncbi:MAG: hypothetical protein RIB63_12020, partial [Fulvivirga sp.]